jgi:hypothetical protein
VAPPVAVSVVLVPEQIATAALTPIVGAPTVVNVTEESAEPAGLITLMIPSTVSAGVVTVKVVAVEAVITPGKTTPLALLKSTEVTVLKLAPVRVID